MITTTLIVCNFCNNLIQRSLTRYNSDLKKGQKLFFCSRSCVSKYKSVERECLYCCKKIRRFNSVAAKFKNSFCSHTCSATYSNTHKTKGTRRSKLEKYLEEELTLLFPQLEIKFNCKDVIKSELDIYVPRFRLAIELNGIHHFDPIYGEKKLEKIQQNDLSKIEACNKQLITLVTINTSNQKKWTCASSKDYLTSIRELLSSYVLM